MTAKKYPGVSRTPSGKFRARIRIDGVLKHLGTFLTAELADAARRAAYAEHLARRAAELKAQAAGESFDFAAKMSEPSDSFIDAVRNRPDAQKFNESMQQLREGK